jgi:hypothetical protein
MRCVCCMSTSFETEIFDIFFMLVVHQENEKRIKKNSENQKNSVLAGKYTSCSVHFFVILRVCVL